MTIALTVGPGTKGLGEVQQRHRLAGGLSARLAGTYGGGANSQGYRVEARVVVAGTSTGVTEWQILADQDVAMSTWEGTFTSETIPAGGQYQWEIRIVHHESGLEEYDTLLGDSWGLGDLWRLDGQSNAVDMVLGPASTNNSSPSSKDSFYGPTFTWLRTLDLDGPNALAHNFVLTNAVYDDSGPVTVTETGAFANYTWQAGDTVLLFGAGISPTYVEIASKVNNDQITLVDAPFAGIIAGIKSQPRSNGVTAFLNTLRAAYVAAADDVPIGVVLGANDGAALTRKANLTAAGAYAGTFEWLDAQSPATDAMQLAANALQLGGDKLACRGLIWLQGEQEAILPATGVFDYVPGTNDHYRNLIRLKTALEKIEAWDFGKPNLVVGVINGVREAGAGTVNYAGLTSLAPVREQLIRFAQDHDLAVFSAAGLAFLDGIHFTSAGQESLGVRAGLAAAASIGYGTRAIGPYIQEGVVGDPGAVAGGTATSKDKITLWVKHDEGTDLTLGTNSHALFEAFDQAGPLHVSAVAKGSYNAGLQTLVLTVTRDTAQTAAADRPFSAPSMIIGSVVGVRYLAHPGFAHGGAPLNKAIFDNDTTPLPLLPTWGLQVPGKPREVVTTPLEDLPDQSLEYVRCEITSIVNLAAKRIVVEAPTGWQATAGANAQIRPGDRFHIETTARVYVGEGTISKVFAYTDEDTTVDLELSHDMASQAPQVGDFIVIKNTTETAGCVLVLGPNARSHGL